MVASAWVLLGLMALCGTTWSHPVGDANLITFPETEISSESSESNEDTGILAELKPIEVADPEGTDAELESTHEGVKSSEEDSGEAVLEANGDGSEVRATSEASAPRLVDNQEGADGQISDS